MNRAELVFKVVDVVMHSTQNAVHFDNITVEKDISYSDLDKSCMADFYYRDKTVKKPVFIYIHGGGYVMGGKCHRVSIGEYWADKDYFVYNADHRLAPKYNYPAPILDIYNMAKHIESIAIEYNLDLSKVVIGGDSSGGYMASQFLATLYNKDLHDYLELPECSLKISAYVGICSAYDVVKMMRSPTVPFGVGRVVGDSFFGMKLKPNYSNLKEYKYAEYISPINFINNNWCPCMILYSKKDLFCFRQSEAMIEQLKKNSVPFEECSSGNIINNHCYQLALKSKVAKEAMQKTKEFLDKII